MPQAMITNLFRAPSHNSFYPETTPHTRLPLHQDHNAQVACRIQGQDY